MTHNGVRCNAYRACRNPARFIVVIHHLNCCVEKTGDTVYDTVWLMCGACRKTTSDRIGKVVGEMFADIPDDQPETVVPYCNTCGRMVRDVDDVMKTQELEL